MLSVRPMGPGTLETKTPMPPSPDRAARPSSPVSDSPSETLGVVAGSGDLPRRVVAACRDWGRPVFLVGLEGQADPADWPGDLPQMWIRLGRAAAAAETLRDKGIRHLCLAGAVRRPSLRALWPDLRTAAFLAKVGAQALGDDRLLSAILRELETEFGFVIEAPHAVIGGGLAPAGVLGAVEPDDLARRDLAQAFRIAKGIGALDIGQGAVVQQGMVLAVEAIEGTDALLARVGPLQRSGPGGVLVKALKPGQDRRVDLPTIGPRTVTGAHAAGLRGLGVEAGATNLIDHQGVIDRADALGLFVVGMTDPDPASEEEDPA